MEGPSHRVGSIVASASILAFYVTYEGTSHFFLYTLMGWDIALVFLLGVTTHGGSLSRFDGLLPLALALYALTPDVLYRFGPFHRDWMDLFLFYVSLDETLPFALPLLTIVWIVLLVGYLRVRMVTFLSEHHYEADRPQHTDITVSVR